MNACQYSVYIRRTGERKKTQAAKFLELIEACEWAIVKSGAWYYRNGFTFTIVHRGRVIRKYRRGFSVDLKPRR